MWEVVALTLFVICCALFFGVAIIANVYYRRDRKAMSPEKRKAADLADKIEAQTFQP